MKIWKLESDAILPRRATMGSVGYDLFSGECCQIYPQKRRKILTNISIEFPSGTYGHILSRSGLAKNNDISVPTGTLDCDYTGNIGVLLHNTSETEIFTVKKGDRIAQMVVQNYIHTDIVEMKSQRKQKNEGRNSMGWGST